MITLPYPDKEALTRLQVHNDLIIKPADKGSATYMVVMSKINHLAEAQAQLSDSRYYRKPDTDPTEHFTDSVRELIQEMMDDSYLHKNTKKYLIPVLPKIARFYLLPIETMLGRLIMFSCGAPMEQVSKYANHHLQPLVLKIPSYLKGTIDFFNKLITLGTLLQGCILVTLEVFSLYTNISMLNRWKHSEVALDTRQNPDPVPIHTM